MPASANVLTLSQNLENLNVKHDISAASSCEDVSVDEDFNTSTFSATPAKHAEKKSQRNLPWFASLPDKQQHSAFIKNAVELMLEKAVFESTNRSTRVVEWKAPEELLKLVDMSLPNNPETHERLLQLMKDVIQYSVKTGHPYFVNQLFSR